MRLIGLAVVLVVTLVNIVLVGGNVASRAFAFNEPDGFRGVPWGATEEQLRTILDGPNWGRRNIEFCMDYTGEQRRFGDRACSGSFVLGSVKVDTIYTF